MKFNLFCNLFENLSDDLSNTNMRYNPEEDTINKINLKDTRKNKLTLKMINRLKKMRIAKNIENINKKKILGIMYSTPPEE